ncbi:MAG: pyridoxal phosphate-dependent aminotransferase [Acholeplasmatales bacterium]|nr:pyridoxal phosphate-dependent aminotransferase [Acholeplasmatales bacterium]
MNKEMLNLGSNRSIIRELFEFSKQRKQEIGEDNVFDFSLGNPSVKPNPELNKALIKIINDGDDTYTHGYTSAPGDNNTRKKIVDDLNKKFNTSYDINNIYMTCGAAASLCIALRALVESKNDEVLALAPYFTEYKVFAEGAGATFKVVKPDMKSFGINFDELEKEINKNTKAIIVNSPNNPSGVVYSEESLKKLAELLRNKETIYNHPIYIICDEPYREIVFDGIKIAHIPNLYDDTIVCYSYSKSLSLPGERIGYVLVPNKAADSKNLFLACLGAGRAYGYVCAPSLMQHAIELCADKTSDMNEYKKNRDLIYNGLTNIGYECVKPEGAFYLFMKALEDDAYEFMEKAKKHNIIVVPSDNFGVKGYVRLAYCVSSKTITNSMKAFKELFDEYK